MKWLMVLVLGILGFVAYEICKPIPKIERKEISQPAAPIVAATEQPSVATPAPVVVEKKFDMDAAKSKLSDIKVKLVTVTDILADLREKHIEAIPALGPEVIKKASTMRSEIVSNQDKIVDLKDRIASTDSKARALANEIHSPEYRTETRYVTRNNNSGTTRVNGVIQNQNNQNNVVVEKVKVADTTRGNTVASLVSDSTNLKGDLAELKEKAKKLSSDYDAFRVELQGKYTKEFNGLQFEKNKLIKAIKENE